MKYCQGTMCHEYKTKDRIKSMKNKNVSRKDKILARLKYEEQAQN